MTKLHDDIFETVSVQNAYEKLGCLLFRLFPDFEIVEQRK